MHDASTSLAYDMVPASEVQSEVGGELTRMTTKRPKKKVSTGKAAAESIEHPMPFLRAFGEFFEAWMATNYPDGRPEPEDVFHFVETNELKRMRRRDWEAMNACMAIGAIMSSGKDRWATARIASWSDRFVRRRKSAPQPDSDHESALDELQDWTFRAGIWCYMDLLSATGDQQALWHAATTIASAAMIALKRGELSALERRGQFSMIEHATRYLDDAYARGERAAARIMPATTERTIGEEIASTARSKWPVFFSGEVSLQHATMVAHIWIDTVRTNVRLAPFVRRYGSVWASPEATRKAELSLGQFIYKLCQSADSDDADRGSLKLTRKLLSILGVKKPENYLRE